MLARAGLRDDAFLAHAQRQQGLTDSVVQLVGAGVAQVLALEVNMRATEVLAEAGRRVQRGGSPDKCSAVARQLQLELGIGLGLVPDVLELFQRPHQSLGDVLTTVRSKTPSLRVAHRLSRGPPRCARRERKPAPCPGP